MALTETAGRWLRVSDKGQDEANQEPSIDGHIAQKGYATGPTYRLHGASASKGKQQKLLDQVIADMTAGIIQVLVVWYSARIERRGAYDHFKLAHLVRQAGGRIEYVAEPWLNETNSMSDVMLALAAGANKQYSDTLSMNVRIAFDVIDANGGVRGRAPYGYRVVGEDKNKELVLFLDESTVVEYIFRSYKAGASLQEIADDLNGQGIPSPTWKGKPGKCWYAKTLSGILRNPIYAGRWMNEARTKTLMRLPEPLAFITLADWRACDKRMASRAHRRGVPTRKASALLTSVLFCGICGGPMYRQKGNTTSQKEVWNADRTAKVIRKYQVKAAVKYNYYCRSGKKCAMLIEESFMDRLFEAWLQSAFAGRSIMQDVRIAGNDHQNEIDNLERDLAELMQDVTADNWLASVSAAREEIMRLRGSAEPARVESRKISGTQIVALWTATTDPAERRRMLLDAELRFYVTKDDDREIVLSVDGPASLALAA